ncbi:hypothetical protein [Streptomyces sp. NPDC001970]
MRQLSAPGRCAVWIATALAVAASAGCMSIGDDGGEGAPVKSPQQKGAAAEPDGGGAAQGGAGGHGRTGMGGAAQSGGAASKGGGEDAGAGASPSASVASSAQPPKGGGGSGGVKPADPQGPTPPAGEPTLSAEPTPPAGESTPPVDPTPPGPDPSGAPTDSPSASPAADTQMGAMRAADEDGEGVRAEPTASPQMEPASRVRGPGGGRWM